MAIKDILQKRRSVRSFTEEAVSKSDIETLLHAAMSGPSAANKQPWQFYVITDPDTLAKLRKATRYTNITAPLDIVVLGDLHRAPTGTMAEYWIQDCSAATQNILLQAVDLGLGAVWCGVHPQEQGIINVREALGITDDDLVPLNVIHIGHPAKESAPSDYYDEQKVHFIP